MARKFPALNLEGAMTAGGGTDDDIPLGERKTVTDFCYLLDKSKQLFNGLRDLPQYGQKQWQSYFGRTFDVYTKLWKFQQQHRQILDNRYGLKRWQIGEIASKIGQLYYHYYLRTSETSYLNEAFSFYSAIRQRAYYSQVTKEDRPELVVKKLRYYARYIVVCLLLNKMDLVGDLVKELSDEIEDYTHRFNTEDQLEWNLVLQEVAAFVEADPVIVLNDDNSIMVTSNRLAEGVVPPLEQGMVAGQLALADALIVGNCSSQVKFSELTIDMFRMLQALEREPINLASQLNKTGNQHRNLILRRPNMCSTNTLVEEWAAMYVQLNAEGSHGLAVTISVRQMVLDMNQKHESSHGYRNHGIAVVLGSDFQDAVPVITAGLHGLVGRSPFLLVNLAALYGALNAKAVQSTTP
ncbi:protein SCAI [Rhincodon typus]|uniref:protein SCAI n=1 Tax=Rhincodon typus TaxID=259920 RepID=UPI00202FA802|nr:protein SCAI [Rhincodon typus]